MDQFIGALELVFVHAATTGLFILATVLMYREYDHRRAGIACLVLSTLQAAFVAMLVVASANAGIATPIIDIATPLVITFTNLALGFYLVTKWYRQMQPVRP